MQKQSIIVIFFLFTFSKSFGQERKIFSHIPLFDENKNIVAYIDDTYCIYHWQEGQKIAYLVYNPQTQFHDVINKKNQKLGYWRDGIIFNFYKKVVLVEENALEKYMQQLNADKGIEAVLLDLEIQGWISLKEFLGTKKP